MTREEINALLLERAALERMLAETPEEELIERRSLTARLDSIAKALEGAAPDTSRPARARLTFRGRPVVGSHGIFAEFGTFATKAFTDAVALIAASFDTELSATGPIPNRGQNQLLITRTATGSFGFELEEYREDQLPFEEESPVAQALARVQELFESAASGTDDDLTEAASGQDARVLATIRDFLKKLADNDAVCALDFAGRSVGFRDVGSVRRSLERLQQDNVHETPRRYRGTFLGILPRRRTFEFEVEETREVLAGKIASQYAEPAAINRHLGEAIEVEFTETRLGSGRPRFVLANEPEWPRIPA
jgi:hypothetical protein